MQSSDKYNVTCTCKNEHVHSERDRKNIFILPNDILLVENAIKQRERTMKLYCMYLETIM